MERRRLGHIYTTIGNEVKSGQGGFFKNYDVKTGSRKQLPTTMTCLKPVILSKRTGVPLNQ